MGFLDKIFKKEEVREEEQVGTVADEYGEGPECSVCGQPGADKKWAGQMFHRRCLRKMRKQAKGMM